MTLSVRRVRDIFGVLVLCAGSVLPAFAQRAEPDHWQQGTALSLFGGASSTGSDTSAAAGAALGWELTPRFTIDGSGIWADGPTGSTAFAAVIGTRINLRSRRTAVPFLSGGIGLYRASFAADAGGMPRFYQRRLGDGLQMRRDRHEFTDFAVALGGGVEVFLHRHLALRPDVRVLLVTANSNVRAVTFVGVHLAYHFESHNVTPARRPR